MDNIPPDVLEARKKLAKKFNRNNSQRGKNSSRRTKTVNHKQTSEVSQILSSLRECGLQQVEHTIEANIFANDGMVYHFEHPEVKCSLEYNTTVIIGKAAFSKMDVYFPDILPQLGRGVLDAAMHVALEMMNSDE